MVDPILREEELETIEACVRNNQHGRILGLELIELLRGYRTYLRSTQEPGAGGVAVAWRYKLYAGDPEWTISKESPSGALVEPLYTHPVPAAAPAPGVVETLRGVIKWIEVEYADAGCEPEGEWLAPEARQQHRKLCELLATLSTLSPAPVSEGLVTEAMVEAGARAYAERTHGTGCPVWEEELPPMRLASPQPANPAQVTDAWLVTNGPDGLSAKVVVGFDSLKREVVAAVFGDGNDDSEEAQDMRDRLDAPGDWEGDRWSMSWSFEDGYLNVQRITDLSALTAAIGAGGQAVAEGEQEWHRIDGPGSILLYTLMQDGWRKGEPVMVNDVMVRIEAANGSETPIEQIAERILSTLSNPPAQPGWRSMDSAPNDGTKIQVWADGYEWPEIIYYERYDDATAAEAGSDGYWRYADNLFADVAEVEADTLNYWQPLPAAPQPKGDA